jgi:hypothetical protein
MYCAADGVSVQLKAFLFRVRQYVEGFQKLGSLRRGHD